MTQIESFRGLEPKIHNGAWIAPGAIIVGDVEIGDKSSVWYGSVVRGDVNTIRIGQYCSIQDGSIVHVNQSPSHPTVMGDYVTIGHKVCLHGCTLQDETLVGIGANILNGAIIEKHSIVAAGALVREGQVVKEGTLVAGVPAKEIRILSEKEREMFKKHAIHYWDDLAAHYPPTKI
ncbi:MAG: gamma carbonic anhydrase family protein [Planctomycetes bacterium]|nr:gamma carbonic anhydrase family protein [Planctomycetota bacterium]